MTPEIESLAQQLIEAADGAQKAADDDWNWRYEGTIIDPDKRAYIHLASPENITAVILAFREELTELKGYQLNYEHATKLERQDHAEELKQARRDAWWNDFRPIIDAIGEISVQEAMTAIERNL